MAKAKPSTGGDQAKKAAPDPHRDQKSGRFVKGNKSGGRPKLPTEIKEMCRALTPQAIETAKNIMLNDKAKDSDRLKAAEIILDRGYGKPAQSVNLETDDGVPRYVFVGMDNVAP